MNKTTYNDINETLYSHKLKNGLQVFMLHKEGFQKTYATISTNFGSINTTVINGKEQPIPEGIAHFLEHKLFEQDNEDISTIFAKQQASCNAFTQNDRTTYLFSCTDMFYENLKLLLDFVFHPKFTEEGVEKEKSIIEQEIKMYLDNPSTEVYMGIINNLFKSHTIRNEILGSVDSINTITVDILEQTHKAYYHPSNMVLFVIGNIEPNATIKFLEENCTHDFKEMIPQKKIKKESLVINRKTAKSYKDILVPNYLLGLRIPEVKKEDILKKELAISVLLDLVLGKSTKNYMDLISKELINDSFGMDITLDDTYGYFLIGSETNNPVTLHKHLLELLQNINPDDLLEEDFLRTKKQTLGSYIQALNSIEFIANSFTKYYYQNNSLFNVLNASRELSLDDVKQAISLFKNDDLYSSYTLYPKEEKLI